MGLDEELYVVSCWTIRWESEPLPLDEAHDLCASPLAIHPFEGGCRTSHEVVPYDV